MSIRRITTFFIIIFGEIIGFTVPGIILGIDFLIPTVTGFIAILYTTGLHLYTHWVEKAELKIEYAHKKPIILERTYIVKGEPVSVLKIRVKAINTGDKLLTNCEAKAEIIPKDEPMEEDAAILHWARRIITTKEPDDKFHFTYGGKKPDSKDLELALPSYENPFAPIDINREDSEFLDVIKSYDDCFTLFSDRHVRRIGHYYGNGKYTLKITIYSPDLPQPEVAEYEIVKDTGWKSIQVRLTKPYLDEKENPVGRLKKWIPNKIKFLFGFILINTGLVLNYLNKMKEKKKVHKK